MLYSFIIHTKKNIIRKKNFIIKNLIVLLIFTLMYQYIPLILNNEEDKKQFNTFQNSLYYTIMTHFGVGTSEMIPRSKIMRNLSIFHILFVFLFVI